jgi:transcriptional regulator with GAF, ATPase, and Fis domain
VSKRRGERGSGVPEPTKALAAENAELRRALQREVAERDRLQKELGQETARRGEAEAALGEAQSHERAVSEILRVISGSPSDIQPVFDAIAAAATRLCDARYTGVFSFDGTRIHLAAHHGMTPDELDGLQRAFPRAPGRDSVTARAILTGELIHAPDFAADPEYRVDTIARAGFRTALAVPMIHGGAPIGAITVSRNRVEPFSDRQVGLLRTFADQAVIAIENVRLFTELRVRNADLSEALEQQTATSEILQVISSSPTDVRPVFEAVVENAMRLSESTFGACGGSTDALRIVSHRRTDRWLQGSCSSRTTR